jgi:hypothetical protein
MLNTIGKVLSDRLTKYGVLIHFSSGKQPRNLDISVVLVISALPKDEPVTRTKNSTDTTISGTNIMIAGPSPSLIPLSECSTSVTR